jgi:hypothetical protein
MKPNILIVTIVVLLSLCAAARAQDLPKSGDWIRVQSDNGEFSIEVPDDYSYFFDAEGFSVVDDRKDYVVREMNLLNAFRDDTLISFETYRASPDAMSPLWKATLERGVDSNKSRFHGIEVRELVRTEDKISDRGDKFYFVSRYFKSKEFVYVLTGLSRQGETPAMKRFFESLKFTPGGGPLLPGVQRFGELKVSPVEVKLVDPPPTPDKNAAAPLRPATPDPDSRPVLIASKPRAYYVKKARDNNTMGAVRLRLLLSDKGYIPRIDVVRTLPDGLARQSVFAALRIKFLPAVRGGKLAPIGKIVEYTFSIY